MVNGDLRGARAVAEAIVAETAAIRATLASAEEPSRRRSPEKWSAAEQVEHLRLSVRPLNLAFIVPSFLLRIFGTATSPGRTYDEIVADYQARLARGARASGPFIPGRLTQGSDLPSLLAAFEKAYAGYAAKLLAAEGTPLDSIRLPHPILGRLSVREMAFFTLYHLRHHHALIRRQVHPA